MVSCDWHSNTVATLTQQMEEQAEVLNFFSQQVAASKEDELLREIEEEDRKFYQESADVQRRLTEHRI